MTYERELQNSIELALEAGELLRRDFHRWGGPRGYRDHAEADTEAEWLIRNRLVKEFPAYRYRGEETGSVETEDDHVWLIDPNDGTSSYLRGGRGSAVSIGLVRKGIPVLGVVYAFAAPDDRGDLICWSEGSELTRNGKAVRPAWDLSQRNHVVLLVSTHREHLMETILETIYPFRYRAFPSIAYRLALAAVGDGDAAISWHNPGDWDYAAGHALLRGAGGIFVNEEGREVTYASDGASKVKRCFGGHPALVRDLWQRSWGQVQSRHFNKTTSHSNSPFLFARLKAGHAVTDASLLSRAQGALLGQVAGDALGSQVEFSDPVTIRNRYPLGVRKMEDGGTWNTMAGQPTDDSELALLLARSIVEHGKYEHEKVASAYHYWYHDSDPFDVGAATAQAMRGVTLEHVREGRAAEIMRFNASRETQANGSLMRISPLGIHGYRMKPAELWKLANAESSLTHPNPVCGQCCGLFCASIAHAVSTDSDGKRTYEYALHLAEGNEVDPVVLQTLRSAASELPVTTGKSGWILIAFQNAFYQLIHSNTFEDGIVDTVMQGGDTDTNAAIAGALLGAVFGREAVAADWRRLVLSCRPDTAARAQRPRPWCFWPVDLLNLAELLLLCG
jgi:ADP-ribosylglycohydrolase/fructose-1,6-bisphosphatase/inositol monophosphatase family enzyme